MIYNLLESVLICFIWKCCLCNYMPIYHLRLAVFRVFYIQKMRGCFSVKARKFRIVHWVNSVDLWNSLMKLSHIDRCERSYRSMWTLVSVGVNVRIGRSKTLYWELGATLYNTNTRLRKCAIKKGWTRISPCDIRVHPILDMSCCFIIYRGWCAV